MNDYVCLYIGIGRIRMAKDYFMQYYKDLFKKTLSPLGFKLKGKTFYRVVNHEIVQTLNVHRMRFGYTFWINIGFFPFCLDIDFKDNLTYELEKMTQKSPPFWEYDIHNISSIENVLNNALESVKNIAIPLFEEVTNTEKYYETICYYDQKIYGKILKVNGNILYACLKIRKYDDALDITYAIEEQNYDAMKANRCLYLDENEYMKYCQRVEEGLNDVRNIRNAILNKNYSYLSKIVSQNEKIMEAKCIDFLKIKFK
jgi:hypothetical protein